MVMMFICFRDMLIQLYHEGGCSLQCLCIVLFCLAMTHVSLILSTPLIFMEVCSIGGLYGSAVASACIRVSYRCNQCLACKEPRG